MAAMAPRISLCGSGPSDLETQGDVEVKVCWDETQEAPKKTRNPRGFDGYVDCLALSENGLYLKLPLGSQHFPNLKYLPSGNLT